MEKRITRDANKAGVKVAAGSDSDQVTFVQYEMKLLVNEAYTFGSTCFCY
jgi:imidazolonepropionase-like amidohydrolase